jgi:phosphoserine phosphatase RsbU/P
MATPARVLTIEDDTVTRKSICAVLKRNGFDVLEAEDGEQGLASYKNDRPDLVLCDLQLPGLSGLEILRHITTSDPDHPVIVVSGSMEMSDAVSALRLGAWDYLLKPIEDWNALVVSVWKALDRARLVRENREYRDQLEQSYRQLREDESAARHIQFQLLPPPRSIINHIECTRLLRTSAYLSGDFLDCFSIDDHRMGFYIADVSGHGVSSAFITVLLKTTMSMLLDEYHQKANNTVLLPVEVFRHLNAEIARRHFEKYLTMFYGVVDRQMGTLRYANAGHFPWPIFLNGGSARFLEDKNVPVGLFENASYTEATLDLPEKYILALFSDGLLEVMPEGSLKSRMEMLRLEIEKPGASIETIAWNLGLANIGSPVDDITLLMVRPAS